MQLTSDEGKRADHRSAETHVSRSGNLNSATANITSAKARAYNGFGCSVVGFDCATLQNFCSPLHCNSGQDEGFPVLSCMHICCECLQCVDRCMPCVIFASHVISALAIDVRPSSSVPCADRAAGQCLVLDHVLCRGRYAQLDAIQCSRSWSHLSGPASCLGRCGAALNAWFLRDAVSGLHRRSRALLLQPVLRQCDRVFLHRAHDDPVGAVHVCRV